jgi:AcrR family transcriptional regulator
MPKDRPEESRHAEERPFTTASASAGAERERRARAAAFEAELGRTALRLSGELGYGALTVQRILDAVGTSRGRFYASFGGKGECFAAGYGDAIEALCADLLAPGQRADDWLDGLHGALGALGRFAAADPALARGVLVEVYVADGAAMEKRKEVFERLSRAIDRARRETTEPRHSPPPSTPAFILNAAEYAVTRSLLSGREEDFASAIPDLLYLAAALYFGNDAAGAAYRRARRRGAGRAPRHGRLP